MTHDILNGLYSILAVFSYLMGGAVFSGLFKRFTGGTDAVIFFGWPLFLAVMPFLGLLWLCAKTYEFCSGDKS